MSLPAAALVAVTLLAGSPLGLDRAELEAVGRKIWRNEAGGRVEGLVSWNRGEAFASVGIGHFLWFPAGSRAPFRESFPELLDFLRGRGAVPPPWIPPGAPCPWPDRAAFRRAAGSREVRELRAFLEDTVAEQTAFLVRRATRALPEVVAGSADPAATRARLDALLATPEGTFALVDYVNFKGEGLDPRERHGDVGWGLAQVLADMAPGTCPVRAFRDAAKRVLTRRVLADPRGHETRWLRGWLARCDRYLEPLLPGRPPPCASGKSR